VLTAELGQRVYCVSAIEMARHLTKAMAENRLHRELKNLTRPKLLVLDEVGYLSLDSTQASLLFQVICQRYEKQAALILTSNKAFSSWGEVFAGDAIMASAALDRLLHRCTVINIRGESYRLREKRQSGLSHNLLPPPSPPSLAPPSAPKSPKRRGQGQDSDGHTNNTDPDATNEFPGNPQTGPADEA
jgi:hypothetical protein